MSTSDRAWTAPNRLLMPRNSRSGWRSGATEGGWPSGHPPVSLTECLGYEIPAVVQADAYAAVQMSVLVQKPSATTVSLMLDFVTATGVNRTEAMSFFPLFTVLPLVIEEGTEAPVARS